MNSCRVVTGAEIKGTSEMQKLRAHSASCPEQPRHEFTSPAGELATNHKQSPNR